MFVVVLLLTFLASRHVTAPSEIPLAHEDLGAYQLVSRVALVGDDGSVDEVRVRRALPPVGDLGQLGTGVVPRHLCLPLGAVGGAEERSDRAGNGKLRITDILAIHINTMRKDNGTGMRKYFNNATFSWVMSSKFSILYKGIKTT